MDRPTPAAPVSFAPHEDPADPFTQEDSAVFAQLLARDSEPLAAAYRRGERWALREVYRECLPAVRRVITYGCLGLRPAATADREDLIQDVFIRAFSKTARENLDAERGCLRYVLRIARNRLVDHWRQTRHRQTTDPARVADASLGQASGCHDVYREPELSESEHSPDWNRLRCAALEFLRGEPDEIQSFVLHRYLGDLSQAQTSEALSWSRRRVRTLEKRVQVGLSKHLRAQGLDWRAVLQAS